MAALQPLRITSTNSIFKSRILHCKNWKYYGLSRCYSAFEPSRYPDFEDENKHHSVKDALKHLKGEFKKFAKEQKAHIGLPLHKLMKEVRHHDYEVIYKFDSQEIINQWKIIADSSFKQGKSEAEFTLGPQKHGIFRGVVNTELIKDGIVTSAGYAGIRSPLAKKSFNRSAPLDWTRFTHLLIRCRGDGRPYQVSIGMDRAFDINWHDQYSFTLFTRGGPYWQLAKIPFRRFFLSYKGRIQDKQELMVRDKVLYLAITQSDGFSGPFHIEIDFIGVLYDAGHLDIHEYELYSTDKING